MIRGIPFNIEGKKIVTINSGEYYISDDPSVVIHTLLGSCVAVCLYDERSGVGGMNHFMLPEAGGVQNIGYGRYGFQSLEFMIDQLILKGAVFQNIKAKVFGGGNMMDFRSQTNDIAKSNILFTLSYLESRRIPIISKELGGRSGRKIYYVLEDHSVYVQRLNREEK
jgi:Chemotaxis protein; stimulates methylation of MCP proteins